MMNNRIVQILVTSASTITMFVMGIITDAWSHYAMGAMGLCILVAVIFVDQSKANPTPNEPSEDELTPQAE